MRQARDTVVTTQLLKLRHRDPKAAFTSWHFGISNYSLGHIILYSTHRQGQLAKTCECSNEPSGSVKCGEFLD